MSLRCLDGREVVFEYLVWNIWCLHCFVEDYKREIQKVRIFVETVNMMFTYAAEAHGAISCQLDQFSLFRPISM